MTTGLRATAIEELCHTLGLRTPIGVIASAQNPPARHDTNAVAKFSDEQLTALGVLAQPEAIAIVTQWPVVHVIATRGAWLAEHVIEGDTHHLHAADVENAAVLLLDRAGLVHDVDAPGYEPLDATLGAYLRMAELARAGDQPRAVAALVGDGADAVASAALVAAFAHRHTEVAGLGHDGRRFVGCEVAFAGHDATGRWLVPSSQHGSSGRLRVIIEPTTTAALREELALIFGAT